MIRAPISARLRVTLGIVSIAATLVGYEILSARQREKNPQDKTLPSLTVLVSGFFELLKPHPRTGEIWLADDAQASGVRLAIGLSVASVASVFIGVGMACFGILEGIAGPMVTLASKLNPVAMLAVYFVLFGTGEPMYAAMLITGILPSLTTAIYHSAKYDVAEELVHKTYTLGGSHLQVIWCVVIRQILPKIIEGIRSQVGPAMVFLIAAEMVVGEAGFGYRIRLQSRLVDMKTVYLYIAILAAFGFFLDTFLRYAGTVLCPWYAGRSDRQING